MSQYSYAGAFGRNLGLVSEDEQSRLRHTRIALPGLGGVGGAHLQTLARMGVGHFHLADPDRFEVVNFNRQLGANMSTVGLGKSATSAAVAESINPEAEISVFETGVTAANAEAFLRGVDIVVDGIEFFCIEARRLLYDECRKRAIPVVNAGPIGYGASLLVFMPDGLSFDEYFGISGEMTRAQQLLAFGLGLGPGLAGDIDVSRIDFEAEKGPALCSACMLCAGLAATEVLKLATGRGKVTAAPEGIYVDPFRGRIQPLQPLSQYPRETREHIFAQSFERFPALRRMHERELADRLKVATLTIVS